MSVHQYPTELFYARQWVTELSEVPKLTGSTDDYWATASSPVTTGLSFTLSYKAVESITSAYAFSAAGAIVSVPCSVPSNSAAGSVIVIGAVPDGTIGPLIVTYPLPGMGLEAYGNARSFVEAAGKYHHVHIGSADPIAIINALHNGVNAIERWLEISPTPWSGGVFTEQISFTPHFVPKLSALYAGHINEIAKAVMKLYRQVWALKQVLAVPEYDELEPRDILTLFGNGTKPGLGDLVYALRRLDNLLIQPQFQWEW